MRIWIGTLGVLLASMAFAAHSQPDAETSESGRIWINLGAFSTHLDSDKHYNGDNVGLGVEYELSPDVALLGGRFINSVRRNSN